MFPGAWDANPLRLVAAFWQLFCIQRAAEVRWRAQCTSLRTLHAMHSIGLPGRQRNQVSHIEAHLRSFKRRRRVYQEHLRSRN